MLVPLWEAWACWGLSCAGRGGRPGMPEACHAPKSLAARLNPEVVARASSLKGVSDCAGHRWRGPRRSDSSATSPSRMPVQRMPSPLRTQPKTRMTRMSGLPCPWCPRSPSESVSTHSFSSLSWVGVGSFGPLGRTQFQLSQGIGEDRSRRSPIHAPPASCLDAGR